MSVSGQRICRLAEEASAATDPAEALQLVRALREEIDGFERQQVARALTAGEPVSAVARALGVSRQSAHRRFRDLVPSKVHSRRLSSTPEARLAVEYARHEARDLGRPAVGSEHLLLGILRSGDNTTVASLERRGITYDAVRAACARRAADAAPMNAVLAAAARHARRDGADRVGVAHLLAGASHDPNSNAAALLRELDGS